MGMAKVKTCGDCIHADICEHNPNLVLFHRKNEAYCETFKDKANIVEVVRCKDCKHLEISGCYGECGRAYLGIVKPWDFCSRGERKDNERKAD